MELELEGAKATITSFDAGVLSGNAHATGSFEFANGKPDYTLKINLTGAKAAEVGNLVGQNWTGSSFNTNGEIKLSGFTAAELSASATGTLHFDWSKGSLAGTLPAELEKSFGHFDQWSGDATIANGAVKLGTNLLTNAKHTTAIDASITLTTPAKVTFATAKAAKP